MVECAGVAQLVERQPSKLNVASSNLVSRSKVAGVAQLAEHVLGKDEVGGSSPLSSSNRPLNVPWWGTERSLFFIGCSSRFGSGPRCGFGLWLRTE